MWLQYWLRHSWAKLRSKASGGEVLTSKDWDGATVTSHWAGGRSSGTSTVTVWGRQNWHKFILSRFGFWEREHTDEITVSWTRKTQNINISQSFLLLTPTGGVFEPLRWLLRAPLNHSATWDPTGVSPYLGEQQNLRWCTSVQTMPLKNGWGCRTFQNASYIHWFSIYSVWAPWSVVDRHMAAH